MTENMPPIREVDLSSTNFTLEYWQREAECQKNWREAAEQENKENIHYLACMTEQRNKYKTALEEIKIEAEKFDYWGNNLTDASNVINSIKEKIDEVLQ